jgi:hypothetical protein
VESAKQGQAMSYWVNASQSAEERRAKYRIAKESGLSSWQARKLRDVTRPHFPAFLNAYVSHLNEDELIEDIRDSNIREGSFSLENQEIETWGV